MKLDLDNMTEEEGLQFLLKRAAEKRQAAEKKAMDMASLGQFANQYKPELLGGALGGGLGALGAYAYGDDDEEPSSSRALRGMFGGMAGAGLGALGGRALGSLYASGLKPMDRINPRAEAKADVDAAATSIAPQSDLTKLVSEGQAGSGSPLATIVPGTLTGGAAAYAAHKYGPRGIDADLLAGKLRSENAEFERLVKQQKAVGATAAQIASSASVLPDVPSHLKPYSDYLQEWRKGNQNSVASPPTYEEWIQAATKPTRRSAALGIASTPQKNTIDALAARARADGGNSGATNESSLGGYDNARSKLTQDVTAGGFFERNRGYRVNKPKAMRTALAGAAGSAVPDVLSWFLPNVINTRGYGPGMAAYNAIAPDSWVSDAELSRRKNQLTAELAAEKLKSMFQQNRDN